MQTGRETAAEDASVHRDGCSVDCPGDRREHGGLRTRQRIPVAIAARARSARAGAVSGHPRGQGTHERPRRGARLRRSRDRAELRHPVLAARLRTIHGRPGATVGRVCVRALFAGSRHDRWRSGNYPVRAVRFRLLLFGTGRLGALRTNDHHGRRPGVVIARGGNLASLLGATLRQ